MPYINTPTQENQRYGNTRTQRQTRFVQRSQSYLPTRNRARNEVEVIGEGKRSSGTKVGVPFKW